MPPLRSWLSGWLSNWLIGWLTGEIAVNNCIVNTFKAPQEVWKYLSIPFRPLETPISWLIWLSGWHQAMELSILLLMSHLRNLDPAILEPALHLFMNGCSIHIHAWRNYSSSTCYKPNVLPLLTRSITQNDFLKDFLAKICDFLVLRRLERFPSSLAPCDHLSMCKADTHI